MFKVASNCINTFPQLALETGFFALLRRTIKLLEYPVNTIEAILFAKRHKINIVHFQSINEIELLMVLAFKCIGKKIVFTIHNVKPRHGKIKWYHTIIYRIIYKLCDHHIIHSKSGKDELVQLFSVAPDKISVIPHGDYKFFKPESMRTGKQAKSFLGIPETCKTMLFFGAIRPNKGLEIILFALKLIKSHCSNIKLLIVGEPCEDYKKYKMIIENENLQENIFEKLEYIPHEEVALYFAASDIVVLPYHEITQSGVLQIAYAFGKPVVATAVGGFNEVVENGRNGYLVPPNDIDALANKITTLINDGSKLSTMGSYSRYLSETKYSWDAIAIQTLNVYSTYA